MYISLVPFAVISRPTGETAVTLTQRFSIPLKTALSGGGGGGGGNPTDFFNLAAVLYQYTQPASKIPFNLCSPRSIFWAIVK